MLSPRRHERARKLQKRPVAWANVELELKPSAVTMAAISLIESKKIRSVALLVPLPRPLHVYAYPMLSLYVAWLYVYVFQYENVLKSEDGAWIGFLLCLAVHAMTFLACQWSIHVRARLTCVETTDIGKAELAKVVPETGNGKGAIIPIEKMSDEAAIEFQKQRFEWNADRKRFEKVRPEWKRSAPTIGELRRSRGMSSAAVERAEASFGRNEFDIPVPAFAELMKEHMMAPFFVFQVFCVLLWWIDQSWINSLFTLFTLLVFESTVVWQRLRTLREFRTMSLKPYDVSVFRDGAWTTVSTARLVPGDIVALERHRDEQFATPCDMVLLRGSCIVNEAMLSGESTPQTKESVATLDSDDPFGSVKAQRNRMVFGGTRIMQTSRQDTLGTASGDAGAVLGADEDAMGPWASGALPPGSSCIAYVLRTGFCTTQGKLVRTIVFSAERLSANNAEALGFICFLLVFAVIAAGYVWRQSYYEPDRLRGKVLLHCIMILTSVVPPELPMQMSLAVNNALMSLYRRYIFVTEPFRIPLGGKIDVMAFDKTGTLTDVSLKVEGLVDATLSAGPREADGLPSGSSCGALCPKMAPEALTTASLATTLTLAGAQALVVVDNEVVGDAMERATLDMLGWTVDRQGVVLPVSDALRAAAAQSGRRFTAEASPSAAAAEYSLQTVRRFAFSSSLKRMSTLSLLRRHGQVLPQRSWFVSCKGAPETVREMLAEVPEGYDSTYKHFARHGSRVLALAWKRLPFGSSKTSGTDARHVERASVESGLVFAGFLMFTCPVRRDSAEALRMLTSSRHHCLMITGDNALTACHVARQVGMVQRDVLVADVRAEVGLSWANLDETTVIPVNVDGKIPAADSPLFHHDLCVTGAALAELLPSTLYHRFLLPRIVVYARASPSQKEDVIRALKAQGFVTLMCGDGTNDVGALKQADVGVALLDNDPEDMPRIERELRRRMLKQRQAEAAAHRARMEQRFGVKLPPLPVEKMPLDQDGPATTAAPALADAVTESQRVAAQVSDPQVRKELQMETARQLLSLTLEEVNSAAGEAPTLKLGDASVAAPFTSKVSTVMSVCHIVRQGRATLVALTQTYKILALNSLIQAYMLSILYLEGVKTGDWQGTFMGVLMVLCVFNLTNSKPLEELAPQRPRTNIFNAYILVSVLGQAAVHVGALVLTRQLALAAGGAVELEQLDLDAEFEPNLLNTAIYLVSLSMQVATFGINYQGRPFRESLTENVWLWRSLRIAALAAFAAALEWFPGFNEALQLVAMPDVFRMQLIAVMVADLVLAAAVEWLCVSFLSWNRGDARLEAAFSDRSAGSTKRR